VKWTLILRNEARGSSGQDLTVARAKSVKTELLPEDFLPAFAKAMRNA
jgi:hypothetical protein